MKIHDILKLANIFYSLAISKEDIPENSKDLDTILKNIENLDSYNSRKEYAEKNLKHLSSGSARLVYLTANDTVIKLAMNEKGLAQNKVEANSKMISKFINKVKRKAKNNSWIETNFLKKITAKQFNKMTGLDFDDFSLAISYGLKDISDESNAKPNNFNEIKNSEIYKELVRIGKEFKLMPGDMTRISSFGYINDHPVLIDAGLTKEVYDKFYE